MVDIWGRYGDMKRTYGGTYRGRYGMDTQDTHRTRVGGTYAAPYRVGGVIFQVL